MCHRPNFVGECKASVFTSVLSSSPQHFLIIDHCANIVLSQTELKLEFLWSLCKRKEKLMSFWILGGI